MSSITRLIHNQSHQVVKRVILGSLWSSNEGLGKSWEELRLLGSVQKEAAVLGGWLPLMRPSIPKGLGKKCKKEEEEEEEKETYINQTSISKLLNLRKLFSFLKFILYRLSDSFSGFSFYYIFFSPSESLHHFRTANIKALYYVWIFSYTLFLRKSIWREHIWTWHDPPPSLFAKDTLSWTNTNQPIKSD